MSESLSQVSSQSSISWYNDISSSEPESQCQLKDNEETMVKRAEEMGKEPSEGPSVSKENKYETPSKGPSDSKEMGKEPLAGPSYSKEAEKAMSSGSEGRDVLWLDSEEFKDGYDSDLMGDEEDRKWFNSLSKEDRQKELFERYQRRQRLRLVYEDKKKDVDTLLEQRLKELYAPKRAAPTPRLMHETKRAVGSGCAVVKERDEKRKKSGGEKSEKKAEAVDPPKASKKQAQAERAQEKKKEEVKEKKPEGKDKKDKSAPKKSSAADSGWNFTAFHFIGSKTKKLKTSEVYSDSD